MKGKAKLSLIVVAALASSGVESLWANGLEFGHVRARTRGWVDEGLGTIGTHANSDASFGGERIVDDAPLPELEREFTEDVLPSDQPDMSEAASGKASYRVAAPDMPIKSEGLGLRVARTVKATVETTVKTTVRTGKSGLKLLQRRERRPNPEDGYLVLGGPPALRFSDVDPADSRPPAPALPEFSFTSSEYDPYLKESALPEDAMNDDSLLSEIVIELEPHEIVSGKIDTRILTQQDSVESFSVDEENSAVLRPEDVLIYFEKDTSAGKSGVIVPFEPSKATAEPLIRSSATLKKE